MASAVIKGTRTPKTSQRANLPLIKYDTLSIYIQSLHIKKILKEYFREKINYNYFIIKCKNFF